MRENTSTNGYIDLSTSGLVGTAIPPSLYQVNTGTVVSTSTNTNMQQQVKVAVFKVTRDESGKIQTSTFLQEMWIEKTAGLSVDFAVAKQLKEDVKPSEIVIKEIYTVTF
jgi:hypothetical protein